MSQTGADSMERGHYSEAGRGISLDLAVLWQIALTEYHDDKLVTTGMMTNLLFQGHRKRSGIQSRICKLVDKFTPEGNMDNGDLNLDPQSSGCKAYKFGVIRTRFDRPRTLMRGEIGARLCYWMFNPTSRGMNYRGEATYDMIGALDVDRQMVLIDALEGKGRTDDGRILPVLQAVRELNDVGRYQFIDLFGSVAKRMVIPVDAGHREQVSLAPIDEQPAGGDTILNPVGTPFKVALRPLMVTGMTRFYATSSSETRDPETGSEPPVAAPTKVIEATAAAGSDVPAPMRTEASETGEGVVHEHDEAVAPHQPAATPESGTGASVGEPPGNDGRVVSFPKKRPARLVAFAALAACCLIAVAAGIRYYSGAEILEVLWRFGSPAASELTPDPGDHKARLKYAYALYHQGQYAEAETELHLIKADTTDPKIQADCNYVIGMIRHETSDFEQALGYFGLAESYYQANYYKTDQHAVAREKARVYLSMDDLDTANKYLQKSREIILTTSPDKQRQWLGYWYAVAYRASLLNGRHKMALDYASERLHMDLSQTQRANALSDFAFVLALNGQLTKAEIYNAWALAALEKVGSDKARIYHAVNKMLIQKCRGQPYEALKDEIEDFALEHNLIELQKGLAIADQSDCMTLR